MRMLQQLADRESWLAFFEHKKAGGHLSGWEEQELSRFIGKEEYLPVVEGILRGEPFPLPRMTVLNKKSTGKKRTVFTFPKAQNWVLKHLAFLLHGYDRLFAPNLYSFRKNTGVRHAMDFLLPRGKRGNWYTYKVDIHDYFNSVDISLLLPRLEQVLEDEPLYRFLAGLLENPLALREGQAVPVKKGIMAGVPVSGFLANFFLREMDQRFYDRGILYARYSDDIIVFAPTEETREQYAREILQTLEAHGLEVNPKKEARTNPGEPWEYLGFSCDGDVVDLSRTALEKIQGKLRRKARTLYRWKCRKQAKDWWAVRAYIKWMERKFYHNPVQNEITWCRWYFPIINTDRSLQSIDRCAVSWLRYIPTGRHTKTNYNLRYEELKELGYHSLVAAYWEGKKQPGSQPGSAPPVSFADTSL